MDENDNTIEKLQAEIEQLQQQNDKLRTENKELIKQNEEFADQGRIFREVEKIAKIGGWQMDLENNGKATWTKGTYDIIEIDYDDPIPGFHEHIFWYKPEYRDIIQQKMTDLAEKEIPLFFEAEAKTKNGNLLWCQAIGEVVKQNGKVVKIRGIFQDVTRRKLAEEEIKKNKILLEASIEAQIDTIIILLDKNYKYLFFNKAHSDEIFNLYQVRPKIGDSVFDFISNREDVKAARQNFAAALKGNSHINIEYYGQADTRNIYETRYNPIYDNNREIIGVTAFSRNVTESIKNEEEIRRYSKIFETSLNEIYLFNANDLKFTQANNAALNNLGYSTDELKQLTPSDIQVNFSYGAFHKMILPLTMKEVDEVVYEAIFRRKNGSLYNVEIHLQMLDFDKEQIFSAIVLDITTRKNAELELEKQRKYLEETVKERTEELVKKNKELDDTLKIFVGRELTIKNLQQRINALEGKQNPKD